MTPHKPQFLMIFCRKMQVGMFVLTVYLDRHRCGLETCCYAPDGRPISCCLLNLQLNNVMHMCKLACRPRIGFQVANYEWVIPGNSSCGHQLFAVNTSTTTVCDKYGHENVKHSKLV